MSCFLFHTGHTAPTHDTSSERSKVHSCQEVAAVRRLIILVGGFFLSSKGILQASTLVIRRVDTEIPSLHCLRFQLGPNGQEIGAAQFAIQVYSLSRSESADTDIPIASSRCMPLVIHVQTPMENICTLSSSNSGAIPVAAWKKTSSVLLHRMDKNHIATAQ